MTPVTRARARPAGRRAAVEKKGGRYHHGDLRRALLDAALEVLAREGAAALTLREVARRAGVTHAAPYRHFTDKQQLLATVAEEGFRMLTSQMREAWAKHEGDPVRGLQAIGVAYVRFATGQRAHFQVMFGKDIDWSREHAGLEETADCCFEVLISAVQACQGAGAIRPGDPLIPSLCAWSMVHGLSELIANGQFSAMELAVPSVEELVSIFNRIFIEGARAKE
jgi:AcrR family transcriptional regulator